MSKEPLWTDAKIKALTVLAANTVDPQARWMHEQIAKDMRNDYERALAFRNEDLGRLQGELGHTKAQCLLIADSLKLVMLERDITQARIAELERQAEKREAELIRQVDCVIDLQPQLRAAQAEIERLRKLVYLAHDTECTCEICVAMPHEPIVCCICNKPIEGDDLDSRFWLHKKDCKFGDGVDMCDCDLECHDTCYAGHEAEYAPPFDDEDDEELP